MPTVRFYGKVLPFNHAGQFTIPELSGVNLEVNPGVMVSYSTRVDQGLINVNCEVDEFKDELIAEIGKGAVDAARTAVDLVAFASGWGWVAQLEFAQLPDGRLIAFIFDMQPLGTLCTAFKIDFRLPENLENFRTAYRTAFKYPALSMALGDLIQSGTTWHIGIQNCGRVIDALRRLLTPPDAPEDRADSWPLLRQAVKADRPYLDYIMERSKGPRHGDRTPIPGREVEECVTRTWTVMNRFLEYMKRGSQPLPDAQFPELHG
jgi:hypothetical protein